MTLPLEFKNDDRLRDVLYQHFIEQLKKVTRSENCSALETSLRDFCTRVTLTAEEMGELWGKWLKMADLVNEPLQPTAFAYRKFFNENAQATSRMGFNGPYLKEKLNAAMPPANTVAITSKLSEPSLFAAQISFLAKQHNNTQIDPVLARLEVTQPVSRMLSRPGGSVEQKEESTHSTENTGLTRSSPANSYLSHQWLSRLGQFSHGTSPMLSSASSQRPINRTNSNNRLSSSSSSSSSTSNVATPNGQGNPGQTRVSPMQIMALPQSALSPLLAAPYNPTVATVPKDRLAQDWHDYVMQGNTDEGFNIKEDGVKKLGDAQLKVTTKNESTVKVEHQASVTRVNVEIAANKVEYNQGIKIAANMATVAYFNNMPEGDVVKLNVKDLQIHSENPAFAEALKHAMGSYIQGMQSKAQSLKSAVSNLPSPAPVPMGGHHHSSNSPLLAHPADFGSSHSASASP